MSETLFPSIQPLAYTDAVSPTEKLYREVKWDYDNNIPIYKNGSPDMVEGRDAVFAWAWKALHTPRFRHEIYTWNYGNEVESLIGQPFTEELKKSEAARYVEECLLINPYISGVENVAVEFAGDTIQVSCTIKTVYGEGEISV